MVYANRRRSFGLLQSYFSQRAGGDTNFGNFANPCFPTPPHVQHLEITALWKGLQVSSYLHMFRRWRCFAARMLLKIRKTMEHLCGVGTPLIHARSVARCCGRVWPDNVRKISRLHCSWLHVTCFGARGGWFMSCHETDTFVKKVYYKNDYKAVVPHHPCIICSLLFLEV